MHGVREIDHGVMVCSADIKSSLLLGSPVLNGTTQYPRSFFNTTLRPLEKRESAYLADWA